MNATRLFVLGALARGGPLHGHGIRRAAQTDRTELWTEVKPGSLYGALGRMAAEGLIEAVCTERAGNLPERTVYGITGKGCAELARLVGAILRDTRLRPDPVDLALVYTDDMPADELRELVEQRRHSYAAQLESFRALYDEAKPHLQGLEPVTFCHVVARLEAEVAFHDQLLDQLKGNR